MQDPVSNAHRSKTTCDGDRTGDEKQRENAAALGGVMLTVKDTSQVQKDGIAPDLSKKNAPAVASA